jgi:hypothetical protein
MYEGETKQNLEKSHGGWCHRPDDNTDQPLLVGKLSSDHIQINSRSPYYCYIYEHSLYYDHIKPLHMFWPKTPGLARGPMTQPKGRMHCFTCFIQVSLASSITSRYFTDPVGCIIVRRVLWTCPTVPLGEELSSILSELTGCSSALHQFYIVVTDILYSECSAEDGVLFQILTIYNWVQLTIL